MYIFQRKSLYFVPVGGNSLDSLFHVFIFILLLFRSVFWYLTQQLKQTGSIFLGLLRCSKRVENQPKKNETSVKKIGCKKYNKKRNQGKNWVQLRKNKVGLLFFRWDKNFILIFFFTIDFLLGYS